MIWRAFKAIRYSTTRRSRAFKPRPAPDTQGAPGGYARPPSETKARPVSWSGWPVGALLRSPRIITTHWPARRNTQGPPWQLADLNSRTRPKCGDLACCSGARGRTQGQLDYRSPLALPGRAGGMVKLSAWNTPDAPFLRLQTGKEARGKGGIGRVFWMDWQ